MYPISNNRFVLTQHIQNSSCSIRKPKSIMSCADVRSSVVSTHIFYNKLFAWLIYFTVVSELTPWDHGMEMVIWSIWSGITEKRHTCAFIGGYISWRINNGERTWIKKKLNRIISFFKNNQVLWSSILFSVFSHCHETGRPWRHLEWKVILIHLTITHRWQKPG